MGEGTVFSLTVHTSSGEGVGVPQYCQWGMGLPPSKGGSPIPGQDRDQVPPSQIKQGLPPSMGYPHPRSGWVDHIPGLDDGTPSQVQDGG